MELSLYFILSNCIVTVLLLLFHHLRSLETGSNAPNSKNDERNAQYLSHVHRQTSLESYLNLLGIFYEETEGEYQGQTKAKVKTCTHTLRASPLIYEEDKEEEYKVSYRLIELTWMTRILIFLDEDESPWHVGHLADNLGVHQVAQADEGGCDA